MMMGTERDYSGQGETFRGGVQRGRGGGKGQILRNFGEERAIHAAGGTAKG